jgi:hypothetical protein
VEDSIGRGHDLYAIHRRPESSKSYPVSLEKAKKVTLEIECFVESGLGRLMSVSKFWVKKCLRKIAGALEGLIEAGGSTVRM